MIEKWCKHCTLQHQFNDVLPKSVVYSTTNTTTTTEEIFEQLSSHHNNHHQNPSAELNGNRLHARRKDRLLYALPTPNNDSLQSSLHVSRENPSRKMKTILCPNCCAYACNCGEGQQKKHNFENPTISTNEHQQNNNNNNNTNINKSQNSEQHQQTSALLKLQQLFTIENFARNLFKHLNSKSSDNSISNITSTTFTNNHSPTTTTSSSSTIISENSSFLCSWKNNMPSKLKTSISEPAAAAAAVSCTTLDEDKHELKSIRKLRRQHGSQQAATILHQIIALVLMFVMIMTLCPIRTVVAHTELVLPRYIRDTQVKVNNQIPANSNGSKYSYFLNLIYSSLNLSFNLSFRMIFSG